MRRVLVLVMLLGATAALVGADPNDLSGGALIAHNTGPWTRYPQLTCATYFQYDPLTNCEDQVNTMDDGQYVWFVIAAFNEDKEWCGVQFGFGDYNPQIMTFIEFAACAPGAFLELPSANWPGPNEGTAFVTTGTPWSGNWQPVYWFSVYTYTQYGSGVVQLIPDPTVSVPFGGFANCVPPSYNMYDAALGGMGVGEPGTWVCPDMVDAVCCVGEGCIIVHSEPECAALGGEYHPEWDNCGPPDPCGMTPTSTASWGQIKSMYR